MADLDLEPELDRLYALPLAEFIAARNVLAKRLRAEGARQAADEVKTLVKPSVAAWAVNVLYHHERRRFDELLEAAAAVRAALAGKGDRRTADGARRKALQALLGRAARILAKAGHTATPVNRQRISHTLEALAARDPAVGGPRPGRLTADLEPQGFDVLVGLVASLAPSGRATTPTRGPVGPPGAKAPTPSPAAVRKQRLVTAQQKVEEQQAAVDRLDRQVEQAREAAAESIERHARLTEEAAEAEQDARRATEAAAAAKEDVAAATAAATKAKAARRQGLSRLATARRRLAKRKG